MRSSLEQANLKNNQARLQLAQINYNREKSLFNKHVTSQSTLDTRYAELLQAQASVDTALAQIQQKTITAPFDGRLGIRQVNLGQYVSPGTTMVPRNPGSTARHVQSARQHFRSLSRPKCECQR